MPVGIDHGSRCRSGLEEFVTWTSGYHLFVLWDTIAGSGQARGVMLWTFDDCVLDVERRELRRAGAPVAVEPQVFDLLVYLLRNRDPCRQQGRTAASGVAGADRLRLGVGESHQRGSGCCRRQRGTAKLSFARCPERAFVSSAMSPRRARIRSRAARHGCRRFPCRSSPRSSCCRSRTSARIRTSGHFADGITEDLTTELARIDGCS